jgi:ankyrin repeat protein
MPQESGVKMSVAPKAQAAVDACEERSLEKLAAAIAGGASEWDGRTEHGMTPLLWAISKRWEEGVAALLAAKASPNLKSKLGSSPLCGAIYLGLFGVANALLDAGADPNSQAGEQSALGMLCEKIGELSENERFNGTGPWVAPLRAQMEPLALRLLQAGADPNGSGDSLSALQSCVAQGAERVAAALLDNGANPDGRKKAAGLTPLGLMCIARPGAHDEAQMALALRLVEAGADLEQQAGGADNGIQRRSIRQEAAGLKEKRKRMLLTLSSAPPALVAIERHLEREALRAEAAAGSGAQTVPARKPKAL